MIIDQQRDLRLPLLRESYKPLISLSFCCFILTIIILSSEVPSISHQVIVVAVAVKAQIMMKRTDRRDNLIDYTCQSQSPFFKNNEFKEISKFASVFGKKLIYDLEDAFNHFAIVAKDSNSRYDNSSYDNDDNDYEEVQDLDLKRILRNRKKLLVRNVLEAFAVMGRGLPLNVFQAWSVAHLLFDVFLINIIAAIIIIADNIIVNPAIHI